ADEFEVLVSGGNGLDLSGYDFLSSLPENATLEGFLFPDTYRLPVDATAPQLIYMMLDNFNLRVTPAMRQSFGIQGLSVYDAVILASIVQREAVVADERPLMVGVFLNRLNAGMPLQADPTVQYALGYLEDVGTWWKSPLSAEDLKIDTPYNTYLYPGLPPGPIANPGLTALEAVSSPERSDFLFFVADCTSENPGLHVFSRTFEEHLSHVNRCR
ncbi:MAG: endolytic transglycosylase MltG, partial [Chloroflexota bacterium]